jgi:PTS system cellobiose-specific IIA component
MEGTELIAFNIIASVGTARSSYIAAIDAAAEGNFEEADKDIKEGQDAYVQGHDAHAKLLTQTAQGTPVQMDLLLTHAEDQLMSAEGFGILAERFIAVWKKIYNK